jgi:microcystin-dependent protein
MSNYYVNVNKTLDDLFEPLQNETRASDTSYKQGDNDLSNLYAPYIEGTTKSQTTNYKIDNSISYPNNQDLNGVFLKKLEFPVGTILIWTATTPPTNYLLCDGASISRTTYINLFTAFGGVNSPYGGVTDNSFNLPNCNAYVPYYDTNNQINYGDHGGSNVATLNSNNLPNHAHNQNFQLGGHAHNVITSNNSINYYHDAVVDNPPSFNDSNAQRLYNAVEPAWPTATDGSTSNSITGSSGTNSNTNTLEVDVQNRYIVINYVIKYQ